MGAFNYIQGGIVAVVVGALALGLHTLDVYRIEAKHAAALKSQQATLEKRCEDEKKITEEVMYDLQQKVSSLNARVIASKRLRPATCVPVALDAARLDHGKTDDAGLSRQDAKSFGLSSDALIDFAADAESVGLRLDACQDFIRKTWALNGESGQ
jgi:hypothetical protein